MNWPSSYRLISLLSVDLCTNSHFSLNFASKIVSCSLQVAQRTYCSPVKETSEEDLKNRPIRFSTSRARSMTVGQTLGERKKSTSMVTVYVSLTIMVILTYIIFFLPPNKQDEEALDILNSSMVANEQDKGQWCGRTPVSKSVLLALEIYIWHINSLSENSIPMFLF